MSATIRRLAGPCPIEGAVRRSMDIADIDTVEALERELYPFPWTRGNFLDSLQASFDIQVLVGGGGLIGYSVAMKVPEELHLLNLSVAVEFQQKGVGRWMLLRLFEEASAQGASSLLLEVRPSNTAAQRLYRSLGFGPIGIRRRYYPSFNNTREDAIVMRCTVDA